MLQKKEHMIMGKENILVVQKKKNSDLHGAPERGE